MCFIVYIQFDRCFEFVFLYFVDFLPVKCDACQKIFWLVVPHGYICVLCTSSISEFFACFVLPVVTVKLMHTMLHVPKILWSDIFS